MASNYPPGVTGSEPEITGEMSDDELYEYIVGDDVDRAWQGDEPAKRERHPLPPVYSAYAVRSMLDEIRQNVILIAQATQDIARELRVAREAWEGGPRE